MSENGEKWLCWTHWAAGTSKSDMVGHIGSWTDGPHCSIDTKSVMERYSGRYGRPNLEAASPTEPPLGRMTATEAAASDLRDRIATVRDSVLLDPRELTVGLDAAKAVARASTETGGYGSYSSAGDLRDWIPSNVAQGRASVESVVASRLVTPQRIDGVSYVRTEDYDALRAECERLHTTRADDWTRYEREMHMLRAERDRIAAVRDKALRDVAMYKSERDRLAAELAEVTEHGEQVRAEMRTEIEEAARAYAELRAENVRMQAELDGLATIRADRDQLHQRLGDSQAEVLQLRNARAHHVCPPAIANPTREQAIEALRRIRTQIPAIIDSILPPTGLPYPAAGLLAAIHEIIDHTSHGSPRTAQETINLVREIACRARQEAS